MGVDRSTGMPENNFQGLASRLNHLHIEHARALTHMAHAFSAGGEAGVLLWLRYRNEDVYAMDICEHFGLTAGRVANIVRKLSQRKYIEREYDAEDHRKAKIRLTPKGQACSEQLFQEMNQSHIRLIQDLGTEEGLNLIKCMEEVASLVEKGMKFHSLDLQ